MVDGWFSRILFPIFLLTLPLLSLPFSSPSLILPLLFTFINFGRNHTGELNNNVWLLSEELLEDGPPVSVGLGRSDGVVTSE